MSSYLSNYIQSQLINFIVLCYNKKINLGEVKRMFNNEKLKKRRLDMGLTLQEVADVVGISMSAVQKYEKGKIKNVYTSIVESFAKALHCSPLYLLNWTDNPNFPESVDNDKLQNLSPENREKALEYIHLLNLLENKQAIEKDNSLDFRKEA